MPEPLRPRHVRKVRLRRRFGEAAGGEKTCTNRRNASKTPQQAAFNAAVLSPYIYNMLKKNKNEKYFEKNVHLYVLCQRGSGIVYYICSTQNCAFYIHI